MRIGENAPRANLLAPISVTPCDVTAQSRCLARPNNLSREASCHSASSSRPLKFLDLKDFATETLPRNRRFGEKNKTVFRYIRFIFCLNRLEITFCGFVWSYNEESAAVVSDRASRWLHCWKSKFPLFHVKLGMDFINLVFNGFLPKMALIIQLM